VVERFVVLKSGKKIVLMFSTKRVDYVVVNSSTVII